MGIIRIRNKKIQRLYFKVLTEEEKNRVFNTKEGKKQFLKERTHGVKIYMEDEQWYDAGYITAKEGFPLQWRKKVNGEYMTINEGAEVDFNAKENGDFNAQIIGSTVDVITNGPENPNPFIYGQKKQESNEGTQSYQKRDYTGVEVGHSINGALAWCNYKFDVSKVLEASNNVHDITKELKEYYKKENPSLSDYDLGAIVGHSVLNACRIGGTKEKLMSNAKSILNDIVPTVTDYVRGVKPEPIVEPDPIPDDDIPF